RPPIGINPPLGQRLREFKRLLGDLALLGPAAVAPLHLQVHRCYAVAEFSVRSCWFRSTASWRFKLRDLLLALHLPLARAGAEHLEEPVPHLLIADLD